ncbi:MAG: non-canonical purine NTP pyrophosphatase [Verrucomicrobiota bacterium]
MITLIIATRNHHKVAEIRQVLSDSFAYLALGDFPDAPPVLEDADSFIGNASKKATSLARWLAGGGRLGSAAVREPWPAFCLADDSGLEVDALGGAPGVHSARFAATNSRGNSSDQANNEKLLRLMAAESNRTARFRCCIALTPVLAPETPPASAVCLAEEAELRTEVFEGTCEGRLERAPRGKAGFGYDPLFVPDGFDQSFAELGTEVKNRISHRAQALVRVREWFRQRAI